MYNGDQSPLRFLVSPSYSVVLQMGEYNQPILNSCADQEEVRLPQGAGFDYIQCWHSQAEN